MRGAVVGESPARRLVLALVLLGLVATVADARQYAWLGVRIRDLSEQEMDEVARRHGIREGFGVFIVEVIEGAPAAKAGLESGDIVVAFDDRPVTEGRMLQRLIASASLDTSVKITVLRTDGRRSLAIRLAAMPQAVAGERVATEFGFVLREPDAEGPRVESGQGGAPAIAAVLRGSAAERAGLEVGDVILQVNARPVMTRDTAREALADTEPERALRLTVRRSGRHVSLTLPVP